MSRRFSSSHACQALRADAAGAAFRRCGLARRRAHGRRKPRGARYANLCLEVGARSRTWRYRKFRNGRSVTQMPGAWPQMTVLEAARTAAEITRRPRTWAPSPRRPARAERVRSRPGERPNGTSRGRSIPAADDKREDGCRVCLGHAPAPPAVEPRRAHPAVSPTIRRGPNPEQREPMNVRSRGSGSRAVSRGAARFRPPCPNRARRLNVKPWAPGSAGQSIRLPVGGSRAEKRRGNSRTGFSRRSSSRFPNRHHGVTAP